MNVSHVLLEIVEKEAFLIYLIGVMVGVGVIKEYNLFHLQFLNKFKDKRISAVLFSMFAGILPVPGRVTVSAGLMDTIATKNPEKRKFFGIIDYLSTHHFYFWSPLEKTLILPLAALGFTWGHWMLYFIGPLIVYLSFLMYYIYKYVPEEAIELNFAEDFNLKEFLIGTAPIFLSIVAAVFITPIIVFGVLALYYMYYMYTQVSSVRETVSRALSYINWKLVLLLAVVLFISVFAVDAMEKVKLGKDVVYLIALIIFGATLLSGEEDVYAALVASVIGVFGPHYLLLLWFSGYFAYSISPLHKCIWISTKYFGTPIIDYYKVITRLIGVLAIYVVLWYGVSAFI